MDIKKLYGIEVKDEGKDISFEFKEVDDMEVKIKLATTPLRLKESLEKVLETKEEHSLNCTLLEIEIGY